MKGTKLLEKLNRYKELNEKYIDKEIRIVLNQPSIGCLSTIGIKSFDIQHGSDLDKDKILIFAEDDIIEKYKDRDIPISPLIVTYSYYDNIKSKTIIKCPICENKLRKIDKYCSNCGQKIKIIND